MKKKMIATLALFLTLSASAVLGTTTAKAMEVSPEAAPAIAVRLLQEKGVRLNSGDVNYVAAVAKEMAQKADFMEAVKGGMDYECAVKHHLVHELSAFEMDEMCTMDMQ